MSMWLKPAVKFRRKAVRREGRGAETRRGESPHRARVGRSILYRQEGKNAHTCIPSALQTGMG